jgi:hypothetical protein
VTILGGMGMATRRRSRYRRTLQLALIGVVILSGTPLRAQGGSSETASRSSSVSLAKAAWYNMNACPGAIDCGAVPPASPYPEGTIHVSVSSGRETARAYLAFDLTALPFDAEIDGGTVTLPLDTTPASGTALSDPLHMDACLVREKFKPVQGSFAKPPSVDCFVKSKARFDDKKQTFSVDLKPFAAKWRTTKASLALLPGEKAIGNSETWHLAFSDAKKKSDGVKPITAEILYSIVSPEDIDEPEPAPPVTDSSIDTPDFTSSAPSISTGTSSAGSFGHFDVAAPQEDLSSVATPEAAGAAATDTAAAEPVALVGFPGPGFAYQGVWIVPLVFLLFGGSIGRVLTKRLYEGRT